jgi:hypothetical protein
MGDGGDPAHFNQLRLPLANKKINQQRLGAPKGGKTKKAETFTTKHAKDTKVLSSVIAPTRLEQQRFLLSVEMTIRNGIVIGTKLFVSTGTPRANENDSACHLERI